MQYVAYSFEAKSIQTYVLASSKLKDRIGASELIESLCATGGLLDKLLEKLNLNSKVKFSRKAGGAFVALFSDENSLNDAKSLQAVWTLTVQKKLPSLRFTQGIGYADNIKDAVNKAKDQQIVNQSQLFPELPLAGPLALFSPRSGRVAYKSVDDEILDEASAVKRAKANNTRIVEKIGLSNGITWPTVMPEEDEKNDTDKKFPLNDDNSIAVLHADINNLGTISLEFLKNLDDKSYLEDAYTFTIAIQDAVTEAVKKASIDLGKHAAKSFTIMPARPLVLAGDDITFILRGDIALEFTHSLLVNLEKTTSTSLKSLRKKYPDLPEYMTACAGIAFIKSSQPLFQAYKLADSLCEMAKNESKSRTTNNPVPSSLAFHRITSSMIERYEDIINNELTANSNRILTLNPYFLGDDVDQQPRLDDLLDLSSLLQSISHSQIRPLLSSLYEEPTKADKTFERWKDVMKRTGREESMKKIIHSLIDLTNHEQKNDIKTKYLNVKLSELFLSHVDKCKDKDKQHTTRTPLADAIALSKLNQKEND